MKHSLLIPLAIIHFKNDELWKTFKHHCFYLSTKINDLNIFNENQILLDLTDSIDENESKALQNSIYELFNDVLASFSRVTYETIFENNAAVSFNKNKKAVLLYLQELGDLTQTAPGEYSYQGGFYAVFKALEALIIKVAQKYNAREQHFGTLISLDAAKSNGYLSNFPHNAFFISHLAENRDAVKRFEQQIKSAGRNENLLFDDTPVYKGILNPTVCYHCFETIRGKKLNSENRVFTAINKCHRFEGREKPGLDRLQVFNMREIIFFGDQTEVLEIRSSIIQDFMAILKKLNLKARIVTASDPFFAGDALKCRVFQSVFQLKYEMQIFIPELDRWIAAASFNLHGDKLVGSYAITILNIEKPHSGCFGIGYERFIYSLYSQLSYDSNVLVDVLNSCLDLEEI